MAAVLASIDFTLCYTSTCLEKHALSLLWRYEKGPKTYRSFPPSVLNDVPYFRGAIHEIAQAPPSLWLKLFSFIYLFSHCSNHIHIARLYKIQQAHNECNNPL